MARNVEIKARTADLNRIRERAAALASQPSFGLRQRDTFFAVPRGRLKLREFGDGTGELISYERPDLLGPKESVYRRFQCDRASDLLVVLNGALPTRGVVVKRREVFLVGRTRIHLDEVENLGSFVELEVVLKPDEAAEEGDCEARDLLRALGIPEDSLVASAYIDFLA